MNKIKTSAIFLVKIRKQNKKGKLKHPIPKSCTEFHAFTIDPLAYTEEEKEDEHMKGSSRRGRGERIRTLTFDIIEKSCNKGVGGGRGRVGKKLGEKK